MTKMYIKIMTAREKIRKAFRDNRGQGAVDQAIIVLISVVLGALILAGLYALMGDTILPTLKEKIQGMFNYSGS